MCTLAAETRAKWLRVGPLQPFSAVVAPHVTISRRFRARAEASWRTGPKHMRREAFEKASLRTRFHRRLARREASQKASLRTCFGPVRHLRTLAAETSAKWLRGGHHSRSSQLKQARNGYVWGHRSRNLCAKANSANMRGEKLLKKLLSAHVSIGDMRGEKLFKKLLSAHVSASPGCAKKESESHVHEEACASSCRTPRTTPPHATHHPPHTPRPWPSLMAMVAIIDGNPLPSLPSMMALMATHCHQ